MNWRKPSHSDLNGGGNCVEIATDKGAIYFIDSRNKHLPSLRFTHQALMTAMKSIRQQRRRNVLNWRKSSYSDVNGGNQCVEVAADEGAILIRDTKNSELRPLKFKHQTIRAFIKATQR